MDADDDVIDADAESDDENAATDDTATDPTATDDAPAEPRALTPESFESFVTTHDLVLVDVWAEWCGPCETQAEVVETLAEDVPDLAVGTVDHDAHPDLTKEYRSLLGRVLTSLPGLFVFVDGDCVERMAGFQAEATLRQTIESYR